MNQMMLHTLFRYHYQRLQEIWESIESLPESTFDQLVPYSIGSLKAHMVHLINDDMGWITLLEGKEKPTPFKRDDFDSRAEVHAQFNQLERYVMAFVAAVDGSISEKPFEWRPPFTSEPQVVTGWQVLLHVVNHGTDHRAQLLRILHDMGAPTFDQDLMGHLVHTGQTIKK